MKKINFRRISEILSEKELKNILGGSDGDSTNCECYLNSTKDGCEKTCCSWKGTTPQSCKYYGATSNSEAFCACG